MQFVDIALAPPPEDWTTATAKKMLQRSRSKAARDAKLGIVEHGIELDAQRIQTSDVMAFAKWNATAQQKMVSYAAQPRQVRFSQQDAQNCSQGAGAEECRSRSFGKPRYTFRQSKFDVEPVVAQSIAAMPRKEESASEEESIPEHTACAKQPRLKRSAPDKFQLQSDVLDDVRVDTHRVVHETVQRDANCFIQRVSRSSGKRYSQLDLDGLVLGREAGEMPPVQQSVVPKSHVHRQRIEKPLVKSTPIQSKRKPISKQEQDWVELDATLDTLDTRPEIERIRTVRFPKPKAPEEDKNQRELESARPVRLQPRKGGNERFAEYVQVQRAK